MNETTTRPRYILDQNGRTEYADLDSFYDALFERGVTVPGVSGSITNEDGSVVEWGEVYTDQQIDDWGNIFGASAEMWSWWRWIEFLDGDWDKPCSVILHIEDPDDETKVVGHLRHPEEIFAALATATELYPWHFVRHCGELDLDASSADVVLQVAALGDVVYG
jgi:hypothetical protein